MDDILYITGLEEEREITINRLQTRFQIKINRSPTSFVGLELKLDDSTFRIHQRRYIERLAAIFGLNNKNHIVTPMETNMKIEKSHNQCDREFRSMIGALLFISRFSRPNISFAVNKLSQYQQ